MEGMMGLVNETVFAFNSEYNLGKDTAKTLMPFCRPSVEKYIFSKVRNSYNHFMQLYDKLFTMYLIKNEADDNLFQTRQGLIKNFKPEDIMEYLGINKKFILVKSKTQEYLAS